MFQLLGINGSTVIGPIKDGKYLYRGIEAHFTLYLALYKIYLNAFFDTHPDLKKAINEYLFHLRNKLENYNVTSKKSIIENHTKFDQMLTELNFQQLQKEFDENLKNQNKFYKNYMLLFETLLLFIRASRQQLWELHLQS